MIRTKKITYTHECEECVSIKCDICDKECLPEDFIDFQEFFSIQKHGGFGSLFGDSNLIKIDICQECMFAITVDIKDQVKKIILKQRPYYAEYNGSGIGSDKVRSSKNSFKKGQKYIVEKIFMSGNNHKVKIKDFCGNWSASYFEIDFEEIKKYDVDIIKLY